MRLIFIPNNQLFALYIFSSCEWLSGILFLIFKRFKEQFAKTQNRTLLKLIVYQTGKMATARPSSHLAHQLQFQQRWTPRQRTGWIPQASPRQSPRPSSDRASVIKEKWTDHSSLAKSPFQVVGMTVHSPEAFRPLHRLVLLTKNMAASTSVPHILGLTLLRAAW